MDVDRTQIVIVLFKKKVFNSIFSPVFIRVNETTKPGY